MSVGVVAREGPFSPVGVGAREGPFSPVGVGAREGALSVGVGAREGTFVLLSPPLSSLPLLSGVEGREAARELGLDTARSEESGNWKTR